MAYLRLNGSEWERIMGRAGPQYENGIDWTDALLAAQEILPKNRQRGHADMKRIVRAGTHVEYYEAWRAARDRLDAQMNGSATAEGERKKTVLWNEGDYSTMLLEVDRLMREQGLALSGAVIAAQAMLPEDRRRNTDSIYASGKRLVEGFAEVRKAAARAAKAAPAPSPVPTPIVAPAPVAAPAPAPVAAVPAVAPAAAPAMAIAPTPPVVVPPYSPRAMDLAAALDRVLRDHATEQAAAHLKQLQHERAVLAQAIGEALLSRVTESVRAVIQEMLGDAPAPDPVVAFAAAAPPAPPVEVQQQPARTTLRVDVVGLKDGYWHGEIRQRLNGLGDSTDIRYVEFSKVGKTTMRDLVVVVGEAPKALIHNIERDHSMIVRCGPSVSRIVETIRGLHATH